MSTEQQLNQCKLNNAQFAWRLWEHIILQLLNVGIGS